MKADRAKFIVALCGLVLMAILSFMVEMVMGRK